MSGQIPWQYSANLKRHYVYSPSRDELIFRNGQVLKRPNALSASTLTEAVYLGDVDVLLRRIQASGPGDEEEDSDDDYVATSEPTSQRRTGQGAVPRTPAARYPMPESQRDALVSGMGGMRLRESPFERNPDNENELLTKVNISRGPQIEGLVKGSGNTAITSVELSGGLSTDRLHPSYRQRDKKFFFVGKIFAILWSEPAGGGTIATTTTEAIVQGPLGEAIFSKIRRFVVIRQGDNYCNALPISTYNGRGVGKRGVKKSEHAIIYSNPLPKPLPSERPGRDEEPMRTGAIRVDPDTQLDKLDPISRINFGHVHTIQYNVRVKSCAKVASECQRDLLTQFAAVFTASQGTTVPGTTAAMRAADNKIQEAIAAMEDLGMSRPDAVRRLLNNLEDKGLSREQAAEVLKKGLSSLSSRSSD